eukprot:3436005-Rhodomonas_salina.2
MGCPVLSERCTLSARFKGRMEEAEAGEVRYPPTRVLCDVRTDPAYDPTRLCAYCAMSGTNPAYPPTRVLCYVRY